MVPLYLLRAWYSQTMDLLNIPDSLRISFISALSLLRILVVHFVDCSNFLFETAKDQIDISNTRSSYRNCSVTNLHPQ